MSTHDGHAMSFNGQKLELTMQGMALGYQQPASFLTFGHTLYQSFTPDQIEADIKSSRSKSQCMYKMIVYPLLPNIILVCPKNIHHIHHIYIYTQSQ